MRKLNTSAAYQQVFVSGAHIDRSTGNRFAIFRLFDVNSGSACQQLRNLTFVPRIQVLHDENGWATGLKVAHDPQERGQATG
jgi:hypothetical protein